MRDRDERTGIGRALRKRGASLRFPGRRKILRQADTEDMPGLVLRVRRRVHFGTQDCREAVAAEGPRVDDRKIVARQEMVGQRQKIVTGVAVVRDDRFRREHRRRSDPNAYGGCPERSGQAAGTH